MIHSSSGLNKPFYRDIATIIASYYAPPQYKFLPWIPTEKIVFTEIDVENPKAISFCMEMLSLKCRVSYISEYKNIALNPNLPVLVDSYPSILRYFSMENLARNISSEIVQYVIDKIVSDSDDYPDDVFHALSSNPTAFDWLMLNRDYIDLTGILYNPKAHQFRCDAYKQNPCILNNDDKHHLWYTYCRENYAVQIIEEEYMTNRRSLSLWWEEISANPAMYHIIQQELSYQDSQIKWDYLSINPKAINILKKHQDLISWKFLATNSNLFAVEMAIEQYQKTHDVEIIEMLCTNPLALSYLEKNTNLIKWNYLSRNPDIFVLTTPPEEYIDAIENLEL